MEGLVRNLKASFPQIVFSFINNVLLNGFITQDFLEFKVALKDWDSDDNSQTKLLKGYGALVFHGIGKKNVIPCLCQICTIGTIEAKTRYEMEVLAFYFR